jgi:hypothetical protein
VEYRETASMISVKPVSEQPLRNQRYLETKLANAAGEKKEALAKWKRDHPTKPEGGYNFKRNSWKAYSDVLTHTETFRENFDDICWCSSDQVSPRCQLHSQKGR